MNNTNIEQTDKKVFYRKMALIATPVALQSLMLALVPACDAFMLGRLTQEQMTAVSLATQIPFIQTMFIASVTAAGAILGAQYWGKRDRQTLKEIFNIMLLGCGLVSLLFFVACETMPGVLMKAFTPDETLIAIGSSYLRVAGWSYLISGISQSYLTIMKVTDRVKTGSLISCTAVVLNVILNMIFIFGLAGIPALEAEGAALATTISRLVELILCIVISFGKEYVRPDILHLFSFPRVLFKDFMRQCFPLLGGGLCWGVGFTTYTAIIGHMGVDAAAANSIAAVVRDLVCCMCNGIASAAGIMIGNELGAGNLERGKEYGIRLKNISFVIGFFSMGLVILVTPLVVNVVVLTDQARDYLTGMMLIMAFYMIGRCFNTVTINGVLSGGGDTFFDMYSLIVCMWLIAIPLAFVGAFVLHWSPLAVYACTCLDEVGKIPWVLLHFRRYKWVRDLTR